MLVGVVRVALQRPYTFVVMALLLLIIGPLAAMRTPTDIFPEIRIPVIATAWQFTGMPPADMAGRVTTLFERYLTTTVNDVEHIEANSYTGIGIVKVFFHPGVNVAVANAQVTSIAQTATKQMPPGMTPPLILNYNAATVPILQLALSGELACREIDRRSPEEPVGTVVCGEQRTDFLFEPLVAATRVAKIGVARDRGNVERGLQQQIDVIPAIIVHWRLGRRALDTTRLSRLSYRASP